MAAVLMAYIGPETIIPATSILAAGIGMFLTFGKWVTRPIFDVFQRIVGKKKPVVEEPKSV